MTANICRIGSQNRVTLPPLSLANNGKIRYTKRREKKFDRQKVISSADSTFWRGKL